MVTAIAFGLGALVGVAYCWLIYTLGRFCRAAEDCAIAETAARTFEADFIPEAADVAPAELETDALLSQVREAAALDEAERTVYEAEIETYLDEALEHLAGLREQTR